MTNSSLIALRMAALRLHELTRSTTVLDVVKWMGALQAQDYESGLWAIGARMAAARRTDVEQAITTREIVRTWPMRGTWHFVPAVDAAWMQRLMASRVMPSIMKRSADFGFDESQVSHARNVVIKSLMGGKSLARETLIENVRLAGINTDEQRGNHLVRRFGNEGLLCNAIIQGKEPTFALLEEWVPKPILLDDEEALATISLRYFTSHGPATVDDFVWWTGLTKGHALRGIAANGKELQVATIDGAEYWFGSVIEPSTASEVELLPAFDEHLLGYRHRSQVLDPDDSESICPGGNGVFRPTIVVGGKVVGVWKRKETTKQVRLELQPFSKLPSQLTKPTARASQRYAEFLNKSLAQ